MANIVIPVTKAEPPFHGIKAEPAVGQSSTAGTAEIFEAAFPAYNVSCYIVATNGNVATVQLKVLSNGAEGYAEESYTTPKNGFVVIGVDPAYMKQSDGTVHVKITPNSATTISTCGVKLYAFYDYDANSLSTDFRLVDYATLDSGLSAIADAIRSKSYSSDTLTFSSGFVSELERIPPTVGYMCYEGVRLVSSTAQTLSIEVNAPSSADSNSLCMDEDGNTLQDGNGVFKYSWNSTSFYTLPSARTFSLRQGDVIAFKFYNTSTNKPFGFCVPNNSGSHECSIRTTQPFSGTIQPLVAARPNQTVDPTSSPSAVSIDQTGFTMRIVCNNS